MQTLDFLQTARWIISQFSADTKQALFGPISLRQQGIRIGVDKPLIPASYELAGLREKLLAHPFASDVLRAFNLERLIDPELPLNIANLVETLSETEEKNLSAVYEKIEEFFRPLRSGWRLLSGCVEPIERLTIPQDVVNEQDFDDILTIELRYGDGINPTIEALSEIFTNVIRLYAAIARLYGIDDFTSLRVVYADSGSSFRFDFKGLGEPIKRIKELLVEGWGLIRHRKTEDFRQNNRALLESLESVKVIHSMKEQGVLNNEDALRLSQQVLESATALFQAGVLPREVPKVEVVQNQKLIEEYHRKLLPPAPDEQSSKNGKKRQKSNKPKSRRSRKSSSSKLKKKS